MSKHSLNGKKYSVVLIDPPWSYYGDPNKDGAAGKEYDLMTDEDIKNLPIKSILDKNAYVFMWATCPRLDLAIDTIRSWGLYYRGVGHIWVKTNKEGGVIHAQGVPPTYSKPTTELILVATTTKKGRPIDLINKAVPQVVLSPRPGAHSVKPNIFHDIIENAFESTTNKIEIFARTKYKSWDAIGNGIDGEDIFTTLKKMTE
jgi:N6-adenosine-specific RNA methylase IME4